MRKFTGPSNRLQGGNDVQRSVNLYPVRVEVVGAKSIEQLASIPGLDRFSLPVLVYTSWPYPLEAAEAFAAGLSVPLAGSLIGTFDVALDAGLSLPLAGDLVPVLQVYGNWPAEALNAGLSLPQSGTLDVVLVVYGNWPAESLNAGLSVPLSGSLTVVLIVYPNWPAEAFDAGLSIPLSGTLV